MTKKIIVATLTIILLLAGCQQKQTNKQISEPKSDFKCLEPSKKIIPTGFKLESTDLFGAVCHYQYEGKGTLNFDYSNKKTYEEKLKNENSDNDIKYRITEFDCQNNPGYLLEYDLFEDGKYKEKWARCKFKDGYLTVHSTNREADNLIKMVKEYFNQLSTEN